MSEINTSLSFTEEKALSLLGKGHAPGIVAQAIGISESRISQLLADPDFAKKVAEARFKHLSSYDERDSRYDNLEDAALDKLERALPLMFKPMEILRVVKDLNAMKRRGAQTPVETSARGEIVPLLLPQVLVQNFTVNSANQVISAGDQSLITIQASALDDIVRKKQDVNNATKPPLLIKEEPKNVQDAIPVAIKADALANLRKEFAARTEASRTAGAQQAARQQIVESRPVENRS